MARPLRRLSAVSQQQPDEYLYAWERGYSETGQWEDARAARRTRLVTVDSHACSFGTCGRHIRSVRGEVSVLRFWTEKLFCGSGEYEEYESLL